MGYPYLIPRAMPQEKIYSEVGENKEEKGEGGGHIMGGFFEDFNAVLVLRFGQSDACCGMRGC